MKKIHLFLVGTYRNCLYINCNVTIFEDHGTSNTILPYQCFICSVIVYDTQYSKAGASNCIHDIFQSNYTYFYIFQLPPAAGMEHSLVAYFTSMSLSEEWPFSLSLCYYKYETQSAHRIPQPFPPFYSSSASRAPAACCTRQRPECALRLPLPPRTQSAGSGSSRICE